jgi:hypothetical protein
MNAVAEGRKRTFCEAFKYCCLFVSNLLNAGGVSGDATRFLPLLGETPQQSY